MNKILLVLLAVIALTGCTTSTAFGPCIGVNERERPNLDYNYSGLNIGLAVAFSETVVVPLVVVLDDIKCPVGEKPKQ